MQNRFPVSTVLDQHMRPVGCDRNGRRVFHQPTPLAIDQGVSYGAATQKGRSVLRTRAQLVHAGRTARGPMPVSRLFRAVRAGGARRVLGVQGRRLVGLSVAAHGARRRGLVGVMSNCPGEPRAKHCQGSVPTVSQVMLA